MIALALLAIAAAVSVGALAYGASLVITFASTKSALYSVAIAILMAAAFVGVATIATAMLSPPR